MEIELTEELWAEGEPGLMMLSLGDRCTPRKRRLFAAAWFRRLTTNANKSKDSEKALILAEQVADDDLNDDERNFQRQHALFSLTGAPGRWAVVALPGAAGPVVHNLLEGWHDRVVRRSNSGIVWELFGNPFRPIALDPAWLTSDVLALARGIYDDRAFDRMPILADALQDAGCDNIDVLSHCRSEKPHARGCWVIDLLLGKG